MTVGIISQTPLEVLAKPSTQKARGSQVCLEGVVQPTTQVARVSRVSLEYVVSGDFINTAPDQRLRDAGIWDTYVDTIHTPNSGKNALVFKLKDNQQIDATFDATTGGNFLTTTIDAELGHNTSANAAYNKTNFPANFTGTTWTDTAGTTLAVDSNKADDSMNPVTPGHVSPVSFSTLVPGFSGPIFAHLTPWFRSGGGGGHIDIGLNNNSTDWVTKAIDDMKRRGITGLNVDWYGPTPEYTDNVTLKIKAYCAQVGFTYYIQIDHQAYTTTAQLAALISYLKTTYFTDPNYAKVGGKPMVGFFDTVAGVDYTSVKAGAGVTMYWLFRADATYVDALFDWSHAVSTGVSGSDPYNLTSQHSFLSSANATGKGVMPALSPGFDGYLTKTTAWSKGKYLPRDNGKCWVTNASDVNSHLPTHTIGLQIVTWNDWEEGTEIEAGIDNGLTVNASISTNTLTFSVSGGTGDQSTLSSFKILASPDGINAAVIGTQATGGSGTFNLSSVTGWAANTTYTIYVVAVGKAGILTKKSAGLSYTPTIVASLSNTRWQGRWVYSALMQCSSPNFILYGGRFNWEFTDQPKSGTNWTLVFSLRVGVVFYDSNFQYLSETTFEAGDPHTGTNGWTKIPQQNVAVPVGASYFRYQCAALVAATGSQTSVNTGSGHNYATVKFDDLYAVQQLNVEDVPDPGGGGGGGGGTTTGYPAPINVYGHFTYDAGPGGNPGDGYVVNWYWTNLTILWADGTSTIIPAGIMETKNLNPTAYYFYPYYDVAAGKVAWVDGGSGVSYSGNAVAGFPNVPNFPGNWPTLGFKYAFPSDSVAQHQSQSLFPRVPLSLGGMLASITHAPVVGGGTGGGGRVL